MATRSVLGYSSLIASIRFQDCSCLLYDFTNHNCLLEAVLADCIVGVRRLSSWRLAFSQVLKEAKHFSVTLAIVIKRFSPLLIGSPTLLLLLWSVENSYELARNAFLLPYLVEILHIAVNVMLCSAGLWYYWDFDYEHSWPLRSMISITWDTGLL